jgi:hypothetical protein
MQYGLTTPEPATALNKQTASAGWDRRWGALNGECFRGVGLLFGGQDVGHRVEQDMVGRED